MAKKLRDELKMPAPEMEEEEMDLEGEEMDLEEEEEEMSPLADFSDEELQEELEARGFAVEAPAEEEEAEEEMPEEEEELEL